MRALVVTWDGAGSITPIAALISALNDRGHDVQVLAHNSQRAELESAGGHFHPYSTAPQLDQSENLPAYDFNLWFERFNTPAARDFKDLIALLKPDTLIVDSMMGRSLKVARASKLPFVALVHAAYSAMTAWEADISSADLALCCSFAAFDHGATFPPNMVHVGPLRLPSAGTAWHRRYPERPLVVASLSSGHQGAFQPAALQVICNALGNIPVEGLVTTGRGIAPEEITAPANVTVVRSIDHTSVLPEASLLITHAGHGSVMAALHAGVPMLCMPPIADQPHNAELVHRLKLGETISIRATAPTVALTVMHLLLDEEVRDRSRLFATQNTSTPDPAEAVRLIEGLSKPTHKWWSPLRRA